MPEEFIDRIVQDADRGYHNYSLNEWDPLRKVIVGNADYACVPPVDISARCVSYPGKKDTDVPPSGPYPQQIIDEANQDLEKLVVMLQRSGIEVKRPLRQKTEHSNFCPRDLLFAYKKQAIASPVVLRSRKNNWGSFIDVFQSGELKIIEADQNLELYDTSSIGNPSVSGITETTPAFDASNIIKSNDDLLYLVSNSGNRAGAEVLRKLYKSSEVHVLQPEHSYMHMNNTVAFLREGLMMVNPSHIQDHTTQMPAPFNAWDCIYAPQPTVVDQYPEYCQSSSWINLDVLSLDTKTVILDHNQKETSDALKKHGIKSIMMPLRHSRALGGGFRGVTMDLKRQHD